MEKKPSVNTFDVFDTLIARRCIDPNKIFDMLERKLNINGLAAARIEAERRLWGQKYSLDNIYEQLQKLLSNSDIEIYDIKKQEMMLEISNAIPITENILKVKSGDLLISDMYHSSEFILNLLLSVGFNKKVSLIVTNYGKHDGYIWDLIVDKFNINKHIGDNENSDINIPQKKGIKSEITISYKPNTVESIFLNIGIKEIAEICRESRLSTWSDNDKERNCQINQINFNFPILFFSSIILYKIAKKNKKNKIIFSSRDCNLWVELFKSMYPGEFDVFYYYTSRYAKINSSDDYKTYTQNLFSEDSLLVDICGSGWSIEKLVGSMKKEKIDYFYIHKLPQDREHMKEIFEYKCNNYSIFEEDMSVYNSDFLEIANSDNVGMLRDVKIIHDYPCPIFFDDIRSEDEKRYISIQQKAFHKCISVMKNYNLENILKIDEGICEKLVSIFYAFMSKNNFMIDIFWKSFFVESTGIEKIISDLTKKQMEESRAC